MSAPELSRIVKVRPQAPERIAIEADDAERSALAERFDIPEVRSLIADLAFDGNGPSIEAKGRMVADLIQTCAVSGEEFPVRIDEALHLRFVPVGTLAVADDDEIELDSAGPDEIEYDGESFDVGEAIAQSLGLAIDPFVEGPNADAARRKAGIIDEAAASGPMAEALRAFRPS